MSFLHVTYVSYRSELDKLANNAACDIIGLVTFVGRVERVKSKGNKGKKCSFLSINWKSFFKTKVKLLNFFLKNVSSVKTD